MITATDIALPQSAPASAPAPLRYGAVPAAERVLLCVLFVTMAMSSVAFIEPSPHDGLMAVLLMTAMLTTVRFDRMSVLLLLLLLGWNAGGLMSLLNVPDATKPIQYTGTSIYLAVAALLFTLLFAQNTMHRLAAMRAGYILAAVAAAMASIIGYLNIIPGTFAMVTLNERALGFFKDPNVYGPYLIWPVLFVIARILVEKIRVRDLCILFVLLAGLFLSFSRGAWMHFLLSATVMLALLVVNIPDRQFRIRVLGLSLGGLVVVGGLLALLLAIPSVREIFLMRANALNDYDVGQGGRFPLQELALGAVLDFPNGMGPFEFARVFGLQQHNVYLQAFLVYGWFGGIIYVLTLLVTILLGLRMAAVSTPWQIYLITGLAAFIGEVGEGIIIDTDHWRHFYLLLGLIWGTSIATMKTFQGGTHRFGFVGQQ